MRNRSGVVFAIVGLAAAAALAAAPPKPAKMALCPIAVDATGAKMGDVLQMLDAHSSATQAVALVQLDDGRATAFGFQRDNILMVSANDLYYLVESSLVWESPDCTGTPYLLPTGFFDQRVFAVSVTNAPGLTLYVEKAGASVQIRELNSYRGADIGAECYTRELSGYSTIEAVATSIDLSRYTPPFTVRFGTCGP